MGDEQGRKVLREHEQITREILKQRGGTEVKTMGDGFMASFGSATKAVECAVALQRSFTERDGEPLSVRVGLNAGEPIEEDGDLFGATVILASRVAAQAAGGEILVTDTVRGLCTGKGFGFADRGEFVPKGFEDPVRIFSVQWLEGASQAAPAHRLPDVWVRRLTSDSGHEVEVVNRSQRDLVDVVVENHEPRANGVDQVRRAVVPLLRAGEAKAVFLKDAQHDYRIDGMGYGVRASWDGGSARFWTAKRKRGAEFEWERQGVDRRGPSPNEESPAVLTTSPFAIRPISGQGFELLRVSETYAQLALKNVGPSFLRKCAFRLIGIDSVVHGHLLPEQFIQPRLLRWSSRERAAYGDEHEWLDFPADAIERFLDVAVLDRSNISTWTIVTADPADRLQFGRGWYRLRLVVSSESDTPQPLAVELRLGLGDRRDPPPPLQLVEWKDGDESKLA